ncbi:MAG: hypothetical protein GXO94_03345 [Nitrospirae bacterium]|nr:hypothetical protein [Nitrospirota bacterium]
MLRIGLRLVIIAICLFLAVPDTHAATNVAIESTTYDHLMRLEAEGLIRSGILTIRPLSRKEVARLVLEAEGNAADRGPRIRRIIEYLKERFRAEIEGARYVKPLATLYGKVVYADTNEFSKVLNYNNTGDFYKRGPNFRFGLTSNAELGLFSFYVNPEFRYSDGNIILVLKRVYGTFELLGLALQVGRDSQWWGPGYHGAMLFSDNPDPIPMIRLGNPTPVSLPWIFRYLGTFRFSTFLAEMESDRVFPEPFFWGLRLTLKPSAYLDLGLQRTFFLGGRGETETFSAWYKTMVFENGYDVPQDGHDVPNDQHVGADVKITLPFRWQPLQMYGEIAAEDISSNVTIKGGYLTGVYLPRIFGLDFIDLRGEYARSRKILYHHNIYRSGYTYKRRLIGHHMGGDATDLFVSTSVYGAGDTKYTLYYDREKKGLTRSTPQVSQEFVLAMRQAVSDRTTLSLKWGYEKIRNTGYITGNDTDGILVEFSFESRW